MLALAMHAIEKRKNVSIPVGNSGTDIMFLFHMADKVAVTLLYT